MSALILTGPPELEEADDFALAALHADIDHEEAARTLMARTARRPLTPTEKRKARYHLRRYLERTENARARWHYEQFRRMRSLGDDPDDGGRSDCSENTTAAFYWARKVTGLPIEDPNGLGFSGWGYTGTLLAANRNRSVPDGHTYFIGDFAIYGPSTSHTSHVVTCRKGGNASTAIWTSNGSEAGPYPVRIHYRPDLLGVYRPWSFR